MRAIKKFAFIKSSLRRVRLALTLISCDLEEGLEILIPPELSQSRLPASFRYYDPIIAILKENVSQKLLGSF